MSEEVGTFIEPRVLGFRFFEIFDSDPRSNRPEDRQGAVCLAIKALGAVLIPVCVYPRLAGNRIFARVMVRTSLEHLRPVQSGLLVPVGATVHGHSVLAGRHAVGGHLLVDLAIGLRVAHDGSVHVPPVSVAIVKSAHAA